MAELPVEAHAARSTMPLYKALLTLLALAFCQPAAARAQYPPDPNSGPALTAPLSGPVVSEPASGSVILAPANRPAMPQSAAAGPAVSQPAIPSAYSPAAAAQSSDAGKEMVVEVRIVGNTLPLEKIKPFIRTREGRPFDKELVAEDVRRLDSSKMFVNIKTYFQPTPGGRIVIFEVLERPILLDVKFVGNSKVSKKRLAKRGRAQGRRSAGSLRRRRGPAQNRGILPHQRLRQSPRHTARRRQTTGPPRDFPDQRRRKAKSSNMSPSWATPSPATPGSAPKSTPKSPVLYLFKGELDRKELDEDVND